MVATMSTARRAVLCLAPALVAAVLVRPPPTVQRMVPSRVRAARMEAFSFDPFDRDVFRILMDAQGEARSLGSGTVGTQHLLLAATMQKDDVQASLASIGVTDSSLRAKLRGGQAANLPGLDKLFAATAKDELLPFGRDTERALKSTVQRSKTDGGALSRDELVGWRNVAEVVPRGQRESHSLLDLWKLSGLF